MRWRGERGQASIEWLGLVALVVLVIMGFWLVMPGEAIAGAVVRQVHRALCVVSGGDCEEDRAPCVVASESTEDEEHVNVGFVRIGHDRLLVVERRSDGTVLVTMAKDSSAGGDIGLGADVKVSSSILNLGLGASARVTALTSLGDARTWVFPDGRSADSGMAALADGHTPAAGHAGPTAARSDFSANLHDDVALPWVSGSGDLGTRLTTGFVRDQDGTLTHVLGSWAGGSGLLGAAGASAGGGGSSEETVTIRTDASGRPIDLGVLSSGELRGSASLPAAVQSVAGMLTGTHAPGVGRTGARRWTVERHLDLTQPANARAAADFLDAAMSGGFLAPLARPSVALRERLDVAGVIDARVYDVSDASSGVSGHVAVGGKFGGGISNHTVRLRLLSARQRGPDGLWRERTDCIGGEG